MNKVSEKQYTNSWFAERGGKTWDKLLEGMDIKYALEIGCYEGQASVYLLEKFPDMYLTVADIFDAGLAEDWDGYVDNYESRFDNNVKQHNKRVDKYKGKSFNTLSSIINDCYVYDFIFVDGDHRALPAMGDMILSLPMLNANGIMIIDDYRDITWLKDSVDKFISLLPLDEYSHEVTEDGSQMVIRRIK